MSTSAQSPPVAAKRGTTGMAIYHFLVLDSTNAFALRLLQRGRPRSGTVIVAAHQIAGRGQTGRAWFDSPGQSICLSHILYPQIPPQQQFLLSMATALAVHDTITAYCPDDHITIKWPNDIYISDRKIAGILIQNTIQGNAITSCVAGVGINVFETDFPEDLPNPTSLRIERQRLAAASPPVILRTPLRKYELLDTLISRLAYRFCLVEEDKDALHTAYHAHLYHRDISTAFLFPDTDITRTGTITGVETDGHLVIRWENGEEGRYRHGEVEMASGF